jgi:hypothetical protein
MQVGQFLVRLDGDHDPAILIQTIYHFSLDISHFSFEFHARVEVLRVK